jgi:hypothetical protein
MRIMTVTDCTTGKAHSRVVPDGANDVVVFADFLGDSSIAHYSVEFRDYIPVSGDHAQLEQENARLKVRVQEQEEALQARIRDVDSMAKRLISIGQQVDRQASAEVSLRDHIRRLEKTNADYQNATVVPISTDPVPPTSIITTALGPIPSPPRAVRHPRN